MVLEIRIALPNPHPAFAFSARSMLDALNSFLQKHHHGACHGHATDSLLIAQVRAPSLAVVNELVESYAVKQARVTPGVKLSITEKDGPFLAPGGEEVANSLNTSPVKLTRKYFESLPPGTFVVSGIERNGTPVFAAEVTDSKEGRNAQWVLASAWGAAQRSCRVFLSKSHYQKWRGEMIQFFLSKA